jgi:hypothetical protein
MNAPQRDRQSILHYPSQSAEPTARFRSADPFLPSLAQPKLKKVAGDREQTVSRGMLHLSPLIPIPHRIPKHPSPPTSSPFPRPCYSDKTRNPDLARTRGRRGSVLQPARVIGRIPSDATVQYSTGGGSRRYPAPGNEASRSRVSGSRGGVRGAGVGWAVRRARARGMLPASWTGLAPLNKAVLRTERTAA